jgi:hypothetical protein
MKWAVGCGIILTMSVALVFFLRDNHTYQQAPNEAISESRYYEMKASMPECIDWSKLSLLSSLFRFFVLTQRKQSEE